jgi:hypothetical protein
LSDEGVHYPFELWLQLPSFSFEGGNRPIEHTKMFIEYRDEFVGESTEVDVFSGSSDFVCVAGAGLLGERRDQLNHQRQPDVWLDFFDQVPVRGDVDVCVVARLALPRR